MNQANYFVRLLHELLISRQELLQRALQAGSLENMWKGGGVNTGGKSQKRGAEEEEVVLQKSKVKQEYERYDASHE